MDAKDILFDDIQALCGDAEALGLTNVALVLEFALDVYLRDCVTCDDKQAAAPEPSSQSRKPDVQPTPFLLAQIYRHAS